MLSGDELLRCDLTPLSILLAPLHRNGLWDEQPEAAGPQPNPTNQSRSNRRQRSASSHTASEVSVMNATNVSFNAVFQKSASLPSVKILN
jgi:hypothetical protein